MHFQAMMQKLQNYWNEQGCTVLEAYDTGKAPVL